MSARRIFCASCVALLLQRGLLAFGERAHVAVGRAVGQHGVEIGDLVADVPVGLDGLDERLKLGEFARQLHIGVAVRPGREVGLDRPEPGHQRIELGLRERDGHASSGLAGCNLYPESARSAKDDY